MQGTDSALGFDPRRWTMTTERSTAEIAADLRATTQDDGWLPEEVALHGEAADRLEKLDDLWVAVHGYEQGWPGATEVQELLDYLKSFL